MDFILFTIHSYFKHSNFTYFFQRNANNSILFLLTETEREFCILKLNITEKSSARAHTYIRRFF